MRNHSSIIAAAGIVFVCILAGNTAAEIIPRRAILADADHTSVQVNTDGTRVGWLFTDANGRHLFVRNVDAPSPDVEIAPGAAVVAWQWSGVAHRVLVTTRDETGETLSALPVDGAGATRQALASGSRVRVVGCNATDVIASVVGADSASTGIFRVPMDGPGGERIADLGDADTWWVDAGGRLVAARIPDGFGFRLARLSAGGAWTPFAEVGPLDGVPAGIVSVSRDDRHIYYVARDGGDTTALFELDLASGAKRLLTRDADADILAPGATVDPRTGRPSSVVSYQVRLVRHYVDESLRADIDALATLRPGDVSIVGQSGDDSRWLVRWLNGGPAHYAVWDRRAQRAIDLFDDVPGLAGQTLASRAPLVVRSRDGLDLRCQVYLPVGSDANSDGVPDTPLPAVVFVHGGPWVGFGWNLWTVSRHFQLLANRGYAVIQAGYRGEVGYGMKYVDAGDRAWGSAMNRDLVDIAEQATKLGIAKRGKIAIWGWSYGGYAVATALARAPGTFTCGLAMYGVYDLEGFLRSPFAANDFWRARAGDVDSQDDLARIRDHSPMTHVDAIRNPILVTHGARDDRVPIAQSDTLVSALEKLGRPVTYLVFPDEGHDYARRESWEAFWAVGESFLHEQLGGDAEPMGDEETRARVEIRAGAERVTGWRNAASKNGSGQRG